MGYAVYCRLRDDGIFAAIKVKIRTSEKKSYRRNAGVHQWVVFPGSHVVEGFWIRNPTVLQQSTKGFQFRYLRLYWHLKNVHWKPTAAQPAPPVANQNHSLNRYFGVSNSTAAARSAQEDVAFVPAPTHKDCAGLHVEGLLSENSLQQDQDDVCLKEFAYIFTNFETKAKDLGAETRIHANGKVFIYASQCKRLVSRGSATPRCQKCTDIKEHCSRDTLTRVYNAARAQAICLRTSKPKPSLQRFLQNFMWFRPRARPL